MRDRGRFDLRRSDPFAGDLQRVVAAPLDVPVALVVDARPIAVHPGVWEARPVGLKVAAFLGRRIAPKAASHARPGLANDELAHRAAHGQPLLVDHISSHSRAWPDKGGRLYRGPRRAPDDAPRDLGPARVIDDRAARVADVAEIPPPRIGVPRLAGRSEHEERGAVLGANGIFTRSHQ